MAHVHIEYSANVEENLDMAALCEAIRAAAADIDALPMPGLRVRATRVDHCAIADGDPDHAFVDIICRLRAGRSHGVKSEITEKLFATAQDRLATLMAESSIALSFELQEIDPEFSPKAGTTRDHLATAP
ncbi:MAG: 5-carboxymethyl-2-hydroxymuconate isomerase [Pseudomonadota bacterium]